MSQPADRKAQADAAPATLAGTAGPFPAPSKLGIIFGLVGASAAVAAAALDPGGARQAASQDWAPFVLVGGLLLIGLVADDDGLFAAVGGKLAKFAPNDLVLYVATTILVSCVTAVLNLDTSVAFLTPVLVHLARARRSDEAPLLYACLFMSNGASLLLPGSNLTNLIVLGHLHLSGGAFALRMAPAFAASVVTTSLLLAVAFCKQLARVPREPTAYETTNGPEREAPGVGLLGAAAVLGATVVVVLLSSPALWVAGIGVAATSVRLAQRRDRLSHAVAVVGPEILLGLFGVAVALGAVGRSWNGPAMLLRHLDSWATAAFSAVTSVLTNNLPAASLLAARVPLHPFSLLIGLNLGPNLFVTGSLSSLLWLNGARSAGASPSVSRAARLGVFVVPVSIAAATAALVASGSH